MSASSWDCPVCTLLNDAEDSVCTACQSRRPSVRSFKRPRLETADVISMTSSGDDDVPIGELHRRKRAQARSKPARTYSLPVKAVEPSKPNNPQKDVATVSTNGRRKAVVLSSADTECISLLDDSEDERKNRPIPARKKADRRSSSDDSSGMLDLDAVHALPGVLAVEAVSSPRALHVHDHRDTVDRTIEPVKRNEPKKIDSGSVVSRFTSALLPPKPTQPSKTSKAAGIGSKKSSTSVAQSSSDGAFWLDSRAPKTVDELAVHKKKVDEILEWMKNAKERVKDASRGGLLILMGPAGIGKSTAAEIIARECGFTIREWVDVGAQGGRNKWDEKDTTDAFGRRKFDDDDNSFKEYVSTVEDFKRFVLQSRLFPALQQEGAAVAAAETTLDVKGETPMLLLQDIPRSQSSDYSAQRQVCEQLQQVFQEFLASAAFPAVLIVSEGLEPGDSPSKPALARLIGSDVVNHPATKLIAMNPIPPVKLSKLLTGLLRQERVAALPEAVIKRIVDSSRGDLRHAIVSLQYLSTSSPATLLQHMQTTKSKMRDVFLDEGKGFNAGGETAVATTACGRDDFFDCLHILSKMLYAKRDEFGVLESPPDVLAAISPFDSATTAAFLLENAPSFFTDIGDYASFADTLSTMDCAASKNTFPSQGFGEELRGSCVARAAAVYNQHPAPNTFRPLHRPAMFAVSRISSSNMRWLQHDGLGEPRGTDGGVMQRLQARVTPRERIQHVFPALSVMLKAKNINLLQLRRGVTLPSFSTAECALLLAANHFGEYLSFTATGEAGTRIGQPATSIRRSAAAADTEELLVAPQDDEPVAGLVGEWSALASQHGVDVTALLRASQKNSAGTSENNPHNNTLFSQKSAVAGGVSNTLPDDDITHF